MNRDLFFVTNVRTWKAGYVRRHRKVRIAMRDKLGLSNPRNSGFDCGGSNLENQVLSVCKEFLVDGGWEGRDGSSASRRGVAGLSAR